MRIGSRGQLVVIGGAESRREQSIILAEFVRRAGGAAARIVVFPIASQTPIQTGGKYQDIFGRLGVEEVEVAQIASRADANSEPVLAAVEAASGVFFTGGDQRRITSILGGTEVDSLLHSRVEQGLVLAGTSAGAAMMASTMIVGGIPEATLRVGMVELGPGMEFLSGVIVDQHFEERGRLRRLLSAVAQYPHELGVGIDEDTALIVDGHHARVLGSGSVTIVDASSLSYTNIAENGVHKNDVLALCGIRLHVLPGGYRFDLAKRCLLDESPD